MASRPAPVSDTPKAELIMLFRRKIDRAVVLSIVADGKLQDYVLTPHRLAALIREGVEILAAISMMASEKTHGD